MPTIRLVPSTLYNAAGTSNLTVENGDNAFTNTDSATYATITNITSNTTSRYFYLRGFNFSDIPVGATVTSFAIKFKANQSGISTNFSPYPCDGTTVIDASSTAVHTTVETQTFTDVSASWSDIVGCGDDFGIRFDARRRSRNTTGYMYIYGAEIEVTYTVPSVVSVTGVTLDKATDSVGVGSTTTLTETVAPSNATNKSVTWSTSNSSVATVSSGLVTGVSAGTATITVTTVDGGYTDTCTVTVTPAVTYEYVLTDTMKVGKTYLIANGNSGSVTLLTNESGGTRRLKGASATVSSNKISITSAVKSKAEFECVRYTSGNDNTITVKNGNQYLYCDNANGLRMNTPATLDRFWHYRNNKFWQFKSTVSDGYSDASSEYKYYLTLSGTNFTDSHVSTTSIENSNIPLVYIFELYVPSDDAIYFKDNGSWVGATAVYKKVNGSWVQQYDLTTVFQSGVNYVKGN